MRVHPAKGKRWSETWDSLRPPPGCRTAPRTLDGRGYPLGLKGEEISLGARAFSVADTFDAITSDRVYRRGRPYQDALEEILRFSGTQFDPKVVEAFARVEPDEWETLRSKCPSETVKEQHAMLANTSTTSRRQPPMQLTTKTYPN